MKNLVLGLGNEIKKDDGVGLVVTDLLAEKLDDTSLNFKTLNSGKLMILDEVKGYDKVFLIDSVKTETGSPGEVYFLDLQDMHPSEGVSVAHNFDLRILKENETYEGEELPDVQLIAIETKNPFEFGEELSNELEGKISDIVKNIAIFIRDNVQISSENFSIKNNNFINPNH